MHVPVVRTVYRSTTQLDWSEPATCPHCGFKSRAGVVARGRGYGRTYYGLGRESAQEGANIDAFSSAVSAARRMIERARCPKCGKRAGGVVWLGIRSAFLWSFIVTFGLVVVPGFTGKGLGPGSAVVGVVAFALLVTWSVRRGLAHADEVVRFEPVETITLPLPGSSEPPPAAAPRPPRPRAPAPAASAAPAPAPGPVDPDALELDFDRSWQKKG
jgi:predicted RNA-binding Zn-ribbon protein involved in translation (DUF1610 family)